MMKKVLKILAAVITLVIFIKKIVSIARLYGNTEGALSELTDYQHRRHSGITYRSYYDRYKKQRGDDC